MRPRSSPARRRPLRTPPAHRMRRRPQAPPRRPESPCRPNQTGSTGPIEAGRPADDVSGKRPPGEAVSSDSHAGADGAPPPADESRAKNPCPSAERSLRQDRSACSESSRTGPGPAAALRAADNPLIGSNKAIERSAATASCAAPPSAFTAARSITPSSAAGVPAAAGGEPGSNNGASARYVATKSPPSLTEAASTEAVSTEAISIETPSTAASTKRLSGRRPTI